MIIMYLILGFLVAVVGAIPLGASNIAVINTTLKYSSKQAFKIAITASIAEVILALFALHFNMSVQKFITNNSWIHLVVIILLLSIGIFLCLKKQNSTSLKLNKRKQSNYFTGFVLGILNPPVLIYWLFVINMLNNSRFTLNITSSALVISLFFIGVYFGKLTTLYLYSKCSLLLQTKVRNINTILNKIVGILLIIVGTLNGIKLYFM